LFELIMNCPKTAELVSKMLAPPLREAIWRTFKSLKRSAKL
jgi:hypothetical protein